MLERDRCGGVDTSYTSAHLTAVTDCATVRARLGAWRRSRARELGCRLRGDCPHRSVHSRRTNRLRLRVDARLPARGRLSSRHIQRHRRPSRRGRHGREARLRRAIRRVGSVLRSPGRGVRRPGAHFIHASISRRSHEAIDGDGSFIFDHSEAGEVEDDPPRVIRRPPHRHVRPPGRRDAQPDRRHMRAGSAPRSCRRRFRSTAPTWSVVA